MGRQLSKSGSGALSGAGSGFVSGSLSGASARGRAPYLISSHRGVGY